MDDLQMETRNEHRAPNGSQLQIGQMKAVYTIVERPGHEKKYWVRIGTAWVNKDHSLNVKLDAHPANNQLHIRDPEPSGYQRRDAESNAYPKRDADGGVS